MDTSPSKESTQIVLKGSAAVVQGLLVLGETIPIIGQFAVVLQKALEVIKQASQNEDAIVRLHDHAVDISEGLLPHLSGLSSNPGFNDAFNKLITLMKEIEGSIKDHKKSLLSKVISATDSALVETVISYIRRLTHCKVLVMDLLIIEMHQKIVGRK